MNSPFLQYFSKEKEESLAQLVKKAIAVKQVAGSTLRKFQISKNFLNPNGHEFEPALSIATKIPPDEHSALQKSILLARNGLQRKPICPPRSPLSSLISGCIRSRSHPRSTAITRPTSSTIRNGTQKKETKEIRGSKDAPR